MDFSRIHFTVSRPGMDLEQWGTSKSPTSVAPVKVLLGPITLQADSKDSLARPREKKKERVKPQGRVPIDTGQNCRHTARDKDDNSWARQGKG